jgi:hypothetical protein
MRATPSKEVTAMKSHRFPIAPVIAHPRWCSKVDPAAGGPLKLCLGLVDCSRCGFAQWLDLMDADRPAPPAACHAQVPAAPAAAA